MFEDIDLPIPDMLELKPKGHFRVWLSEGRWIVTVHRPSLPPQHLVCFSIGHANQIRQALTDEGLAGYVDYER